MKQVVNNFFIALRLVAVGNRRYYIWLGTLAFFMVIGFSAYLGQLERGLITTAMRDQISWGLYISNFTFLVGVAAAAVLLVVPAYLYHFKPIKEIVLFGEILAISAITMCILFIIVDMGRPERVWHILPVIGAMNFPSSLLAWDVLVLNGYLAINVFVVFYVLYKLSIGKEYKMSLVAPLVMLSIPWAIGIHTVTAFLYNGLSSRPFWNASILAPRFIASAFCSGPALMLIIFQIIRKMSDVEIENAAIFKIAELIVYAMGLNLFLLGAEAFKEFYSGSIHLAPIQYLYFGLHGKTNFVPWMWAATIMNITAFFLFLFPKTRENLVTLNIGCLFIIAGVYIEKGMGLIIPGFVPDTLGEVYEYIPTMQEILVTIGIWATGAMLFTLMVKFAIPVYTGKLRFTSKTGRGRQGMAVSNIMTRKLITVTADTAIEEISKLIIANRISGVPVVDSDNRVVGMVTQSDIIFRQIHNEPTFAATTEDLVLLKEGMKAEKRFGAGNTAKDIMTSPVITAHENDSIREVVELITKEKIKRVVIVDEEGRLVGIVSKMDIVRALGFEAKNVI